MVNDLSAAVCHLSPAAPIPPSPDDDAMLQDMTIVIMDTFKQFNRTEIANLIECHGGQGSSRVSSKATFVVVSTELGSKLDKAKKVDVRIEYEPVFLEMVGYQ